MFFLYFPNPKSYIYKDLGFFYAFFVTKRKIKIFIVKREYDRQD